MKSSTLLDVSLQGVHSYMALGKHVVCIVHGQLVTQYVIPIYIVHGQLVLPAPDQCRHSAYKGTLNVMPVYIRVSVVLY
jgi:hypothetical protein